MSKKTVPRESAHGLESPDLGWFKSSRSGNGGCVMVKYGSDDIHVRDSKIDAGPVLTYTSREWKAFIEGVKAGEFEGPT
jgi:hypothetical protein